VGEASDAERTQLTGPPDFGPEPVRAPAQPPAQPPVQPAAAPASPQPTVAGGADANDATIPRPPAMSGGDFDAPTIEPPTRKQMPSVSGVGYQEPEPTGRFAELRAIGRDLLKRHEKKIWWLHTAYALGLGAFVATFAQKGFERARLLTLSLGAAWILVVLFFRFFGTGTRQDFITAWPGARRRFFIMSYLMKNLFQGMLFFQLPFYWKSSSFDAKTGGVLGLIAGCAVISTLDLVFDRVLLRFKLIASAFFAVTLFGCLNLVIPALFSNAPTLVTLLVAGGFSVATFLLFHLPLSVLRRPLGAGAFASIILLGVLAFYFGRRAFPAVPMFVKEGGVGTGLREDGSLTIEVRTVRFDELFAVTDVQVVGRGDSFSHVWRRGKDVLEEVPAAAEPSRDKSVVRVSSRLPAKSLPALPVGKYTVDVQTSQGQIVGRVVFDVKP
jgi:hypothetical protein